jgi:hypothetical protein
VLVLGRVGVRARAAQSPQQRDGGHDLDARVHAEADERHRSGDHACRYRDERLDDVPADGEVLQAQGAPMQVLPAAKRQIGGFHQAASRRAARTP